MRSRSYGFIFLPVIVLVLFSLQGTSFPIPPFNGPSLRWYVAVLDDPRLTAALANSLLVAVLVLGPVGSARLPCRLGICPPSRCRAPRSCAG